MEIRAALSGHSIKAIDNMVMFLCSYIVSQTDFSAMPDFYYEFVFIFI